MVPEYAIREDIHYPMLDAPLEPWLGLCKNMLTVRKQRNKPPQDHCEEYDDRNADQSNSLEIQSVSVRYQEHQ